jgi:NADH-ubiquinone oxidoreductase chain 5
MAIPLFVLALGSIFIGYLLKDLFIGLGTPFFKNSIYIEPIKILAIDAEFIPASIKLLPIVLSFFGADLALRLNNVSNNVLTFLQINTLKNTYEFLINK